MSFITPPTRKTPRHPRYDAIHRALLSGLISHVGTKTETHEYAGTRGTRFHVFPGSSLFGQRQKWIVAGEIVETSKLYARNCAAVEVAWIEQAAAHLVERTHSDPRWDSKTASAVATEKVTLHGLVLVPARTVPFSPINSRLAREMFIHHALVLGDYRLGNNVPAYARHNAALISEVETLEAKIRQRNLLADAATRYAFYDARIPLEVTHGPEFENWRKREEKTNAHLLFMNKEDLLRADAPPITPENYPDRLSDPAGNLKLPLIYRYQPGEPADGLTLAVPVAALAQLRPQQYEWLVPGMLEDKIAAMLRELPGGMRRNFVPVPNWAKAAAEALAPDIPHTAVTDDLEIKNQKLKIKNQKSLREALAGYLAQQTGIEIQPTDFADESLPPYLRMTFKVLDDAGNILAQSRDLPALQRKLAPQTAGSFATIAQPAFNRDGITAWDFPDLPEHVTLQRFGMSITAYPALCNAGILPASTDTCALRLFPTRDAVNAAHRAGVRHLFRLVHRREVKHLAQNLPRFIQMALQHFTLGESRILREDLVTLILDRALFTAPEADAPDLPLPRTKSAWESLQHRAAARLNETTDKVAAIVGDLLQQYHELTLALETASHTWGAGALSDVREQLVHLMPPHFLLTTPWQWLIHFPRYLQAMRTRLKKLETGGSQAHQRDMDAAATFTPFWNQYLQRKAQHESVAIADPELALFRWMLEEFRVHLFTQDLGTAVQVSPKRLEKQWGKTTR